MSDADEKLQARGGDMDAPERIWAYSDGLWIEAWDAPPSGAEYIRADLMAELVEAATALEKAARHVSNLGAVTGPQWSKLTIACLKAAAAFSKIKEQTK